MISQTTGVARPLVIGVVMALCLQLSVNCVCAETWYVNNRDGNDANDGLREQSAFRTIARAVKSAKRSDSLSLANTGKVYREALVLIHQGGTPAKPMIIEGNGAVISGLRTIEAGSWEKQGDVYVKVGKYPYGWPMLVINDKRIPPADREDLQPGQWSWVRAKGKNNQGLLRFRPEVGKSIEDYHIEGSFEVSGVRVVSSSYLVIRNLVTEFHSNDGFNVHGDCRSTVFENIEARFNGDDGFSIHEAVEAVVRNGHFHHNGSGIEDVNLSRSFYSGIRVHDNSRLGILFIGAFHSAVDARVYDNPSNFRITPGVTKHLLGGEFSPIQGTSVYLQNVISHGGDAGVVITKRARVMIVNSVFAGSKTGIAAGEGSRLHLTKSVVAHCADWELRLKGESFFGDANVYFPGRFEFGGKKYTPQQWEDFKKAAGHHHFAVKQDPALDSHFRIGEPALKQLGQHVIGPTIYYTYDDDDEEEP